MQPGHHLKGTAVDEVPDEHACLVAEDRICRVAAAPFRGAIDDIVVQEGCRVDELDESRGLDMRGAGIPAGASYKRDQKRAQALAAAGHNMLSDLVDQHHGALQARTNYTVHGDDVR